MFSIICRIAMALVLLLGVKLATPPSGAAQSR